MKLSGDFYAKVLAPLSFSLLVQREKTIGFGKRYPEFWLNERVGMVLVAGDSGFHVCLRCSTQQKVEDFHEIALEHGGRCAGKPGSRQAAMTQYFGAFILDLDGNKIEAVCFPKSN